MQLDPARRLLSALPPHAPSLHGKSCSRPCTLHPEALHRHPAQPGGPCQLCCSPRPHPHVAATACWCALALAARVACTAQLRGCARDCRRLSQAAQGCPAPRGPAQAGHQPARPAHIRGTLTGSPLVSTPCGPRQPFTQPPSQAKTRQRPGKDQQKTSKRPGGKGPRCPADANHLHHLNLTPP